ncbi:Nramp family divalent metal transporter [Candidatus Bathyarchaeota archaeon]|nr:Nramp family divalent metal transporter [Candidatus Bathyarchaeota archaeon]
MEQTMKIGEGPELPVRELPDPGPTTFRNFIKWIGPGVILGSLATGGYEGQYAPWISSLPGGINTMWLCTVGLILSGLMFTAASRYTMATGETFFRGVCRIKPGWLWGPVAFIALYLVFLWPAWVALAGASFATLFGGNTVHWTWALTALGYIILVFSKYVYRIVEAFMTIVLILTSVAVVVFTVAAGPNIWGQAAFGFFLGWLVQNPYALTVPVLGGAAAMVGNHVFQQLSPVCHSGFYTLQMREKGYGMSRYFGHVTGLAYKPEDIAVHGYTFNHKDSKEIEKWKRWLTINRWEVWLIYVLWGCFIFTFLYCLSGLLLLEAGQKVPAAQIPVTIGKGFGAKYGTLVGQFFFFTVGLSFYDAVIGVSDSISRAFTEVVWALSKRARSRSYRFWYYAFLTFLVIIYVVLTPYKQPTELWLIGMASIGVAGIVLFPMLYYLTEKLLPEELRAKGLYGAAEKAGLIISFILACTIGIYWLWQTLVDLMK